MAGVRRLDREDFFYFLLMVHTRKRNTYGMGYDKCRRDGGLYTTFSFSKCINKVQALLGSIGMGYLDLVLLSFPELKRLGWVWRMNWEL